MASSHETRLGNTIIRHKRALRPLVFPSSEPEDEKLGETKRHLVLRTFLFQLLTRALAPANTVGSEQFVYWNASNPRRTCAPDAFVKLGVPDSAFDTWRTWLHGAPELVVEIASAHDREPLTWDEKMERFHEMGVREIVRFDVDAVPGQRIRAWDRVEGAEPGAEDLVEREVAGDTTPCTTLGLHWVVAPAPELPFALRLARDPEGQSLLLSPVEDAEARVAELEAELRKRAGE